MVAFTGFKEVTDEQINALLEIRDQLVWLNMNNTRVTDAQLEGLARLTNLRVLYLNNTSVSDAGVAKLEPLTELRWLSLVGTNVTDQAVPILLKLRKLTDLFLFGTTVSETGIRELLDSREQLKVDTGNYRLEALPTDTVVYRKTAG